MKLQCLLLIDDDPIATYLNQNLIKKLKICDEIKTVSNGAEALTFIKKEKPNHCPDIIFLDINMPVMDGFEFMRNFNSLEIPDKVKIRIVVLTTSSNPKDIVKMEQLGINYFLQKPLKEDAIFKIIGELKDF